MTDKSKKAGKAKSPKHIKHHERVQTAEGWKRSQEKILREQKEVEKKRATKK
jgi:hypothetical protein